MFNKKSAIQLFIICSFWVWSATLVSPTVLQAHDALLEYTEVAAISVQASYHSGKPMAGAQIAVFVQDDPMTPWLTGTADDQGEFSFIPPADQTGTLNVQAGLAGHGATVHIPLVFTSDPGTTERPLNTATYNTGQRLLVAASVVWGFIGTALYFMRRKV